MAGSSYGTIFKLISFGESHGSAIGGVVDGVPAGIILSIDLIQKALDKRKPGQSALVSPRKENDLVEVLSGIFEGKTTGAPIGFIIRNADQKSEDYDTMKMAMRPSHADFTYQQKYGIRDHRGGGRSSARETIARVVAGSIAQQILTELGVEFSTYVDQVGAVKLAKTEFYSSKIIEQSLVRCPDPFCSSEMEQLIQAVKEQGDTIGGCVKCIVKGVPVGLGEPVFDKLHAELGKALFSINAVKAVEFGSGFSSVEMLGSQHNDIFNEDGSTQTNHSGGIQGGISNGMPLEMRVAFKPVATIMQQQPTITTNFEKTTLTGKGRHDACVVPRAVPIVEAMVAMVVLDFYLRNKATRL